MAYSTVLKHCKVKIATIKCDVMIFKKSAMLEKMQLCHTLRFARGTSHILHSHITKFGREISSAVWPISCQGRPRPRLVSQATPSNLKRNGNFAYTELYTLQDSGDFEMRGATSSNTTCNEAGVFYATENERGAPKKKDGPMPMAQL